MADPALRLPGNAPGDFFVDSSCIDCDLCRQIAPSVFRAEGDRSVVHDQPGTPAGVLRAQMALVACPTASIGTASRPALGAAVAAFPELVADEVTFCGFASPKSYGASSYLVRRPGGNVLVDSPRFSEPLARRIEGMGGVRLMFLTHRDDVADHAAFRRRFGCERVMHARDASFPVERRLEGDDPVPLDADLLAIPTPGHTRGHQALLYREKFLFTGDHLWGDGAGGLEASRSVCWHSWDEQRRSVERLLPYPFEWVLPGHGPRLHALPGVMKVRLGELLRRM